MSLIVTHRSIAAMSEDLARLAADVAYLRDAGRPSEAMLRDAPVLHCWGAAERPAPCLVGAVVGHPRLGERPLIRTSEVFAFDLGEGWARTWSRFYRLGAPRSEIAGGGHA